MNGCMHAFIFIHYSQSLKAESNCYKFISCTGRYYKKSNFQAKVIVIKRYDVRIVHLSTWTSMMIYL